MTLDALPLQSRLRKDVPNDICAHIFGVVLNSQQVCGLDFAEYSGQIANAAPLRKLS